MMTHDGLEITTLTLSEIMNRWPQTIAVFLRHRMMCVGCRFGPFHLIDDACSEYFLDRTAFCCELETAIGAGWPPRPG
ncbi:hypothetical protein [Oceaniglobus indicus]|uniref:hypothetical protein n=1 Tax=Oceaniglobus indicus TaxID=2047749 RepID=UPI001F4D4B88|nr:hypothetical protein [Oceaniglobus indicus]